MVRNSGTTQPKSAEPVFSPDCSYCRGFLAPDAKDKTASWNRVVMESANFIVVPTIGMLVPGWLLIVTKHHKLNMGCLSKSHFKELLALKESVRKLLTREFAKPLFFEHGPASCISNAGSCIDHAHLHAVPLGKDILPDLTDWGHWSRLRDSAKTRQCAVNHQPYMFYESPNGARWITKTGNVPCQFIRRIIARKIGAADQWDWTTNPFIGNVEASVNRLTKKRKD